MRIDLEKGSDVKILVQEYEKTHTIESVVNAVGGTQLFANSDL